MTLVETTDLNARLQYGPQAAWQASALRNEAAHIERLSTRWPNFRVSYEP